MLELPVKSFKGLSFSGAVFVCSTYKAELLCYSVVSPAFLFVVFVSHLIYSLE